MARDRGQVNENEAIDIVSQSLGMSLDDLGVDRPDTFGDDNNDNDEDDGDEDIQVRGKNSKEENDEEDDNRSENREEVEVRPQNNKNQLEDFSVKSKFPKNAEVRPDKNGNLIDKDGKIVAKAGREARFYQNAHNARAELQRVTHTTTNQINDLNSRLHKAVDIGQQLHARLSAFKEQGMAHTKAGLNDQEHSQAIELAVMAKTNPVGALKTLLTRAAANGIDLTQLGLQPGGFDTAALLDIVRKEIGTAVKPVQERMHRESEQERLQRENHENNEASKRELQSFLTENPDARNYLPVFQRIYADPVLARMSLSEVWTRIQLNLLKNQQGKSQNSSRRRALPNGRSGTGSRSANGAGNDDLAPVNQSYEEILRGIMK